MIEIQVDDRDVMAAFNRLIASANDLSPAMRKVAGILADATERAFEMEQDPVTGASWAPLKPSTVKRRKGDAHPILQQSGQLAASVQSTSGRDFAQAGTNKEYAATHQFGARKGKFGATRRGVPIPWGDIPARPFLGIGERDKEAIIDVFNAHLFAAIHGR